MKNKRIDELQNFANTFNSNLQKSEIEVEDREIYKKLKNKNIKNKKNKHNDFNSNSTSPRSKSQFRLVNKNIK